MIESLEPKWKVVLWWNLLFTSIVMSMRYMSFSTSLTCLTFSMSVKCSQRIPELLPIAPSLLEEHNTISSKILSNYWFSTEGDACSKEHDNDYGGDDNNLRLIYSLQALQFLLFSFCTDLHCKVYLNTSISIALLNALCWQSREAYECNDEEEDEWLWSCYLSWLFAAQ